MHMQHYTEWTTVMEPIMGVHFLATRVHSVFSSEHSNKINSVFPYSHFASLLRFLRLLPPPFFKVHGVRDVV